MTEKRYKNAEGKIQSSRHKPRKSLIKNDLRGFSIKTGTVPGQQFFSLHNTLSEFCKEKKIMLFKPVPYIDFTPPKLTEGKDWFISYYVRDPSSGRMKRIRMKINRVHPIKERRRVARAIIASLQEKLSLGWNPLVAATAPQADKSLFEMLDVFLRVKKKEMEGQSFRSYESHIRIFRRWLAENGFNEKSLVGSVTKETARAFMSELEDSKDISPRTWNNYLSFQGALWEWLKDKGCVASNVFREIKKKPKRLTKKKRRLLTAEELHRLYCFLEKRNPQYMAVCLLCNYCFIRPKEIALLKVNDLDLRGQRVRVRAEIAKNDNESFRTIPDFVLPHLQRLDLSCPEWYLFGDHKGEGDNFRPGPVAIPKKKLSDYWERVVRPECKFPLDVQLYSLKDTGITEMLSEGVPINQVQRQADHSSVAMTAIYVGRSAPRADDQIRKVNLVKE